MRSPAAARRYARALFALAREENRVDAVREELAALSRVLEQSPPLRDAVFQPLHPGADRRRVLVSVTERTREIGLRLAIGALEREVLLQFLIEAVVLAALGGLVGIVLATGASVALSAVMDVPYQFNLGVNLLSFLFSAAIGVLFGYFPARRAARLNPIDALRHE